GQDAAPPRYSAGVQVVNLFATVRDEQGRMVTGLAKDDFQLDEDGRPQTIRYFSRESDLPLTVGLLIDVSGSMSGLIGQERSAAHDFLRKVLRPQKDLAFVVEFDFEVELLQDATGDRKRLEKALDRVSQPARL